MKITQDTTYTIKGNFFRDHRFESWHMAVILHPKLLAHITPLSAFLCAKTTRTHHNTPLRIKRPYKELSVLSHRAMATSDDDAALPPAVLTSIEKINDLITTDAGGRGMKHLVVPGDLLESSKILARLQSRHVTEPPHVVILTGFPCCVNESPPMETDGLASVAIARAVIQLGYQVTLITEECNAPVFSAAVNDNNDDVMSKITLSFYPSLANPDTMWLLDNYAVLKQLTATSDLVIACERAGPAKDGNCYTMRGINMNEKGLIFPLHRVPQYAKDINVKFIAIGDGGNEMGMGKVIDKIYEHIPDGEKIGAVTPADHLIAASVSNWGAWALIAATALVRFHDKNHTSVGLSNEKKEWVNTLLPSEEAETQLLHRCVAAGCRDGVTGKLEATVDGMPLERSMECLREIRNAALE